MDEGSNETIINIDRPQRIDLPSAEHETRIAIRYIDWSRIKRKVKDMQDPTPRLHLIYSSLFGFSGSSTLSCIIISQSEGLLPWVLPLFICISVFSFISGGAIYLLDRKNREERISEMDECIQDMNEVESTFPSRL